MLRFRSFSLSSVSPPRNSDERPKIIYIHIHIYSWPTSSLTVARRFENISKYFHRSSSVIIRLFLRIRDSDEYALTRFFAFFFFLFYLYFFFSLFFFWQTITNERSFNKRTVYSRREDWRKIRNGGGGDVEMFRN